MATTIRIPDNEIRIETARAGGPGGQNVNKVESKVQLRWRLGSSVVFTQVEKARIRQALMSRLNEADEVMVDVDEERSQAQNRQIAVARLQRLLAGALKPKKIRRRARPPRAARERRLRDKKKISERKQSRRLVDKYQSHSQRWILY